MVDAWGYENGGSGSELGNDQDGGPKALRDAYAAMKAQNESLRESLAEIQKDLRSQKLAATFDSLGVPQAASVYQGEPDPEKVKAWVETMQSVFGTGNASGGNPEPQSQGLAPEVQDQYRRMSEAGSDGQPLSGMDAAFAAVNDATDLNALIAANQRLLNGG